MTAPAEVWLMLAFPESRDGAHFSLRAFAPSKNGKSWFRILPTRESAIQCKRELVADGIKYVCKKVPRAESAPKARTSKPYSSRGNAEKNLPGVQAANKALAAKHQRNAREADKYAAEMRSQAQKAKQAYALKRAERVAVRASNLGS